MSDSGTGILRITLVRSTIGRPADQGRTVESLGLRRLNSTVERPDNPSIRGMVNKIKHLVQVEALVRAETLVQPLLVLAHERPAAWPL